MIYILTQNRKWLAQSVEAANLLKNTYFGDKAVIELAVTSGAVIVTVEIHVATIKLLDAQALAQHLYEKALTCEGG